METRAAAAKRRASAAKIVQIENPQLKKQRVVLGELLDLPNLVAPSVMNQPKEKENLQHWRNPVKRLALTKRILPFPDLILDDPQIDDPYVSDIYKYLRSMEVQKRRRPMVDYTEKVQREVTANMRGILVDWLVEVADEYKLLPDTLHRSVSFVDRFLSVNPVSKSRLQLLGVSSMLIAAKYEEINPPGVDEFCSITDNTYKKTDVVKMEADVLKSLNFEMGNPTVNTFLSWFADVASENQKKPNTQIEFLGCYLSELGLLDYDCLRFLPSVLAASAIFLARFIVSPEVHPWSPSLAEILGYKSIELKECVLILHDLYLSRKAASLQAVREKYKQHKFKYVANLPSPSYIPNHYFEDQWCSATL
ncbi:hypothetical protein VNO77_11184 [Canavalia gladiata]|uniref:B-like cyclin n=1 Tax=Canavalia gladiata TaxID=3824 RepID=A0AAN9MF12_CANGL